ncbi:MAG: hypothetical protein GKR90_10410 [Pseudomonadales bacterium]|nr:hypothetical protein [Pseudomonadales bacterium]
MNLPNLVSNGMPVMGVFVYGPLAAVVPILLDFIGPGVFLFALWYRKPWGPLWALSYIGLFILNNLVALLSVREVLGLPAILGPTIVAGIFLAVIFWQRDYFRRGEGYE